MKFQLCSFICAALALGGCGGGDSKFMPRSSSSMAMSSMMVASSSSAMSSSSVASSEMSSSSIVAMVDVKYTIKVTNLTAGQPFSPLAYSLHYAGFAPFTIGLPATLGLEQIAESGSTDDYIAEAMANVDVLLVDHAMGLTLPGESKMLELSLSVEMANLDQLLFSLVNMLGNTNDGFTGVISIAVGKLAVGESMTLNSLSYDAGTELNSETQATIPGPAGGGEGFNAARDDMADQVTMHPGAITKDDGKMDSTLTHLHRWDNPTARITITRLAP